MFHFSNCNQGGWRTAWFEGEFRGHLAAALGAVLCVATSGYWGAASELLQSESADRDLRCFGCLLLTDIV